MITGSQESETREGFAGAAFAEQRKGERKKKMAGKRTADSCGSSLISGTDRKDLWMLHMSFSPQMLSSRNVIVSGFPAAWGKGRKEREKRERKRRNKERTVTGRERNRREEKRGDQRPANSGRKQLILSTWKAKRCEIMNRVRGISSSPRRVTQTFPFWVVQEDGRCLSFFLFLRSYFLRSFAPCLHLLWLSDNCDWENHIHTYNTREATDCVFWERHVCQSSAASFRLHKRTQRGFWEEEEGLLRGWHA